MKVSREEILEVIENMDTDIVEIFAYDYDVVINKYDLLDSIEKLFESKKEKEKE